MFTLFEAEKAFKQECMIVSRSLVVANSLLPFLPRKTCIQGGLCLRIGCLVKKNRGAANTRVSDKEGGCQEALMLGGVDLSIMLRNNLCILGGNKEPKYNRSCL